MIWRPLVLALLAVGAYEFRQPDDLDVLATTLRREHPKLLIPRVRASFDSVVATARSTDPGGDPRRAVAELVRVAASLHDSHTKVVLTGYPTAVFHSMPIRVYWFEEGVFITRTDSAHASLLGARVDSIARLSAEGAIERLRPYLHNENSTGLRDIAPDRLIVPGLLYVAGISTQRDSVTLVLRSTTGRRLRVTLGAPSTEDAATPLSLLRSVPTLPVYLRDTSKPYWFTSIDSASVFWIQFNEVSDAPGETLAAFAERALDAAERSSARYLVIDVRRNNGGDNTLLRPLLVGLIRSRFNAPGRMFAVTGRLTFSAAVNFVARLRAYTDVTLVGEPTAAPANHYGETQVLHLPVSGAVLLYSSQYWQDGDPRDSSDAINPTITAPPTFRDYRDGRDPAFAAILAATRK